MQRLSEGIILVWTKEVDSIKYLPTRRFIKLFYNINYNSPK